MSIARGGVVRCPKCGSNLSYISDRVEGDEIECPHCGTAIGVCGGPVMPGGRAWEVPMTVGRGESRTAPPSRRESPIDRPLTVEMIETAMAGPGLIEHDITTELWREYDFQGRVYRIDEPLMLFFRPGGTTHRVLGGDGVVHCLPAPGHLGCVLRWQNKDTSRPCQF